MYICCSYIYLLVYIYIYILHSWRFHSRMDRAHVKPRAPSHHLAYVFAFPSSYNWRQSARSLRVKMQFSHWKASTCIIRSPPNKEYCTQFREGITTRTRA